MARTKGTDLLTVAIRTERQALSDQLLNYLMETPDSDLRGRLLNYARWLSRNADEPSEATAQVIARLSLRKDTSARTKVKEDAIRSIRGGA